MLCALEQWRHEWNLLSRLSNFENAFIHSVDGKILALKNGINLSIVINNSEIEDDSVFYQIINTSPSNNVSVFLNNTANDAVRLIVEVGINNSTFEKFENAEFSSELTLRPGDSCGQCYRLPSKITRLLKNGDVVTVIINLVYSGKVICNNRGTQNKFSVPSIKGVLSPNIVSNRVHYGTAVPAFSAAIKGIGREREKADLRELLDSGLAIIYGPSRVGKSSLLAQIETATETSTAFDYSAAEIALADYRKNNTTSVEIEFSNVKNIVDRILTEFSPWEKRCSYDAKTRRYRLTIFYQKPDELDLVVRLLGYGSYLRFVDKEHPIFKEIQLRMTKQMELIEERRKNSNVQEPGDNR